MDVDERYIVPGLKRGLAILQAFSQAQPELSISELSDVVGVTRSSAFRIAYTLEQSGFLKRGDSNKKYKLGYKVLELGFSFLSGIDLVDRAAPYLEKLRTTVNMSTHLLALDGNEIIYLASYKPNSGFTSNVRIGTRLPAHATTAGRVLLCEMPQTDIATLYEGQDLRAYTSKTANTYDKLLVQLEKDRMNRLAISWEHFEKGVCSIAVPIRDHTKTIISAISVSCPASTIEREIFETDVKNDLLACAQSISVACGCPPIP